MTQAEIEAVLQAAFRQCERAGYPLGEVQKQIFAQVVEARLDDRSIVSFNPLAQLTPGQREALWHFIQAQEQQNQSWKAALLNDWLQDSDSGNVQFVRDLYGVQWLESITPAHLAEYADEAILKLKVGDRIEVSNALWEWVSGADPNSREWFPCLVINLQEDPDTAQSTCIIRFENGSEYEIQGIYDWNRSNWRWAAK
ncbi:MAG: hypothetical protein HC780_27840 [Leptolyngbyaceae cyanobacterium CSU_1_3]|nr:hypothetical protein [Leptolyngbyaceae cyanobacterium CSU_1_3]